MHHFVEGLVIGLSVDAVALGAILALRDHVHFGVRPSLLDRLRARVARSFVSPSLGVDERS